MGFVDKMTNKFDKFCSECGCLIESKKGIVKKYFTENFGDEKKPNWKKICKDCDAKLRAMFGAK